MSELVTSAENNSPRVRQPAELQLTAESILHDAYESRETPLKATDYKIADLEELRDYQRRKRTEHESSLRRNRFKFGEWIRYAQFEVDQHDYSRARSVFERALEVEESNVSLWIRYIQVEIKGKNINHARNLLERATRILPRVDKLWYQYVTVEESLGNVLAARNIFENWLQWKPGAEVWKNFVRFEERYNEFDNCRLIFERFVIVYPEPDTWLVWANFEKQHGDNVNVFNVYKLAVDSLFQTGKLNSDIMLSWIQWEVKQKHWNRIKKLYDFSRENLSQSDTLSLQSKYTQFQRQFGDKDEIEISLLTNRKLKYAEELKENPRDYETWWTYLNVIKEHPDFTEQDLKQQYENSLKVQPDSNLKLDWLPYIYLWIRYILWEEQSNKNLDEAGDLYERLLKIIPHKQFTFAKVWISYAEFKIRQNDLAAARKILGRSMGMCPTAIIMKYYFNLELKMKEFDRVRMIYNKLIESFPDIASYWIDYATLEYNLGDDSRSDAIYKLAIEEPLLPTEKKIIILKQVIQLQLENQNFVSARESYDKLVQLSENSLKSVIKRCLFELQIPSDEQVKEYQRKVEESEDSELVFQFAISNDAKQRVRDIFENFIQSARDSKHNETRTILLQSLKNFETKYGDEKTIDLITKRMPKIVQSVRTNENGQQQEYEEYEFPDDEEDVEQEVSDFKATFASQFVSYEPEKNSSSLKRRFEADSDDEETQPSTSRFKSRFEED